MATLPQTASVHEQTVQSVADGSLSTMYDVKRRRRPAAPTVACTTMRVSIAVWRRARALTDDPLCIEVESTGRVVVHNHRNWRRVRRTA